ncbi:hypothetical protein HHL19_34735 [Streptomyces sp. R302]|uniref:DUF6571 family protein n=1 Tax=unclassified Streptomyces TaxID=2593676 RepID=UPI00145EE41A|nr:MULTISPECIES: DUF6571 family protein [unclassified Streptomyces]NML55059.1 hypothetical protein [Streptomyces sp. R301]NML83668.1 hypothetical protein [Streptomyces sp. R302]
MDLETLRQGSFGTLSQAITAWKGVADKLKSLETDARDDLKAKADKANWAGANATVSRSFITKTAGEFSDAHTQAQSIHDILKDTHDELVSYQQQLEQALERGRKKNLTVTPIPGGFTVTMLIHPDRAAKGHDVPDHSPQDAEHLRDDVERILNRATESDSTAATVLRALVDQAETGFSGAKYGDRDTAIDALRKAEEAAKLLKEKGDEMSPEEFRKLNGLLASYKNDPLFQEKFATQVGPKAMLEFWADLSSPDNPNELTRTLDRTQLNQLGDFQKTLGAVLGGATQSDSPAMRQWENDMVRLSGERYKTRGAEVYGYQIMSNLMRTGDYDDQFLNKYGNQLVETEKKMKVPGNFWQGMGQMMPKMNFIGDDEFGRDPMAGFMTALSNSPDAATQFFNTTEPQDNAMWVLKERPAFDDSPLTDGPNETLDATGKAMFAAVSGMTDPKADGATFVEHTDAHRDALKRSMQFLSEEGDDFPPELRDDMAWALGNHGETVHKAMSDPLGSGELDGNQLLEVSKQISRNKDSYALLNEQINYAILADINTEKENPEDSLLNAGSTVGFLEQARQLTINADEAKDLRDTSWDQRWNYHIVGGIANQFGGDWAQRGVDAITAAWAEEEANRVSEKATEERQHNSEERKSQLKALADHWQQVNGEWAEGREGYSDRGVDRKIRSAADHGNDKVDREGGES